MEDLSDPKSESHFIVQDSNGKVVIHTKSNNDHVGLSKSFRMVEAGRNTAKKSISASISTQVDESDLGIDELDQQTDDSIDNNEDLGFDEQLLVDSSKALQPFCENTKKSEMSISTKRVTDMAVRKFREFVKSKELSESFEQYSPEQLDSLLLEFYTDAKKKNGKKLKVSTLRTIRSSLDRYLKTESDKFYFAIAHSPVFQRSNKVLEEVEATEMAERALDVFDESARVVKPISAEDIKTLWESGVIGTNEPKALQRLVFLIVGINFGITTRDDVRQLKPSLFLFCTDTLRGLEFVEINEVQFLASRSKRQKGKLENKIFSIPSSPYCPVAALKLYLEKISPLPQSFYLAPNPNFRKENIWYRREAVGKNTLGRFMRDISIDAHLPHQYVNSSLRITPPEVLSQGISAYRLSMTSPYYSRPTGVQSMQHANMVVNENCVTVPSYSCTVSTKDNVRLTGTSAVPNNNAIVTTRTHSSLSVNQSWAPTVLPRSPANFTWTPNSSPAVVKNTRDVFPLMPPVSIAPSRFAINSGLPLSKRTCVPVQTCPVVCLPYSWEIRDVVKVLQAGEAILLTSAREPSPTQTASNTIRSQPSFFPQLGSQLLKQSDAEQFKQTLASVSSKLVQLEKRTTLEPGTFDAILELRQLQKNLNSFVTKLENAET